MADRLRVGVIGCGVIASIYCENAPRFRDLEIVACADLTPAAAGALAHRFGFAAVSVDQLLASDSVDLALNLTPPAAHFETSMRALEAGKHVYSEKPLCVELAHGRRLVDEANRRRLRLGVAPDTFLGAAGRAARRMIDQGEIGEVIGGTAFVLGLGMESWHPNPGFFYRHGGGPVLDLGPYAITQLVNLLGPVARVSASGRVGRPQRVVTAHGPHKGERIAVSVDTTVFSLLEFAVGALVVFGASWDVPAHGHSAIELYGARASLRAPDPNFMGGAVELAGPGEDWRAFDTTAAPFGAPNDPPANPTLVNDRGLGLADLAASLKAGKPHRASGALGLHVLEVMDAIARASRRGAAAPIASAARPDALEEDAAAALLA